MFGNRALYLRYIFLPNNFNRRKSCTELLRMPNDGRFVVDNLLTIVEGGSLQHMGLSGLLRLFSNLISL